MNSESLQSQPPTKITLNIFVGKNNIGEKRNYSALLVYQGVYTKELN